MLEKRQSVARPKNTTYKAKKKTGAASFPGAPCSVAALFAWGMARNEPLTQEKLTMLLLKIRFSNPFFLD
ncbi:hypothetical protein DSLASN_24070 [Desulfoluna limicola]|uniref:Uncharacterized protein n=1 Tax=Desulfoluna limicola TaxID=2810562 RepID=A0ABM7PGQ4_9BACT|nr:hypothetical protein [Desulfoluna limicola]BCS96775.1 hypothetical protein DSLASN_24070 [Desulfoluna limicola]